MVLRVGRGTDDENGVEGREDVDLGAHIIIKKLAFEGWKGEGRGKKDGEGGGEIAGTLSDDSGEVEDKEGDGFGGSKREGGGCGFEIRKLGGGGGPGGAGAEKEGEVDLHVAFQDLAPFLVGGGCWDGPGDRAWIFKVS